MLNPTDHPAGTLIKRDSKMHDHIYKELENKLLCISDWSTINGNSVMRIAGQTHPSEWFEPRYFLQADPYWFVGMNFVAAASKYRKKLRHDLYYGQLSEEAEDFLRALDKALPDALSEDMANVGRMLDKLQVLTENKIEDIKVFNYIKGVLTSHFTRLLKE